MKKTLLKSVVPMCAAASCMTTMQTASAATASATAPQPSGFEQWAKDVKNPTDWLTWGMDLRVRNEYYNNDASLSDKQNYHEQDYFRFRARIWAGISPLTNLTANIRLTAEPRDWMNPRVAVFRDDGGRTGMQWNYGIVDLANIKWSSVLGQPVTVTAGRQEVMLGENKAWWLVCDGTPMDGSWTYFMDSARVTWDIKDAKTKIDVVGIAQSAFADSWFPVLNNPHNYPNNSRIALTEQHESGGIVYLQNNSIENLQIDGYFIYKGDNKAVANGDDADIYTLGGRLSGVLQDHWQYSADGAYQFGSKSDTTVGTAYRDGIGRRTISAFGVNSKFGYLFKDKFNNQASLIYEGLSGDDPNSKGTDEMFDILWGRYPRWSDLYVFGYTKETGGRPAQMNNLHRIGANWTLNPIKNMTLSTTYSALFAMENTPTRNIDQTVFSNNGNFRGHYIQSILRHQFNSHLSALLQGEVLWQGNYYTRENQMDSFIRAEVNLTF